MIKFTHLQIPKSVDLNWVGPASSWLKSHNLFYGSGWWWHCSRDPRDICLPDIVVDKFKKYLDL